MAEAKIRITAQDNASAVLNKVGGGLGQLNAATLGVTLSLGGLIAGVAKAISAFNEQQLAEARLANALRLTGQLTDSNVQSFKDLAAEMQKTTKFGDEVTLSAAAQLQTLSGLSSEMVRNLIPSVADFASSMQIDLVTAAELVGKSIGSSTNALTRYGIEIDASASSTDKANQILKELSSTFGGAAQAEANTFSGTLAKLGNAFSDLLENVGAFIVSMPEVQGAINLLILAFDKLNSIIGSTSQNTNSLSNQEKILEQRTSELVSVNEELNALFAKGLTSENRLVQIKRDRQKLLIEEIQNINRSISATKAQEQAEQSAAAAAKKAGDDELARLEAQLKAMEADTEAFIAGSEERVAAKQREQQFLKDQEARVAEDQKLQREQEFISLQEQTAKIREAEIVALENRKAVQLQFAQATQAIFSALSNSIANAFTRAFDTTISGLDKTKMFFADFGKAILGILTQLIARMIVFAALSAALGPTGSIFGLGAKALAGFQTPTAGFRTVPGPANAAIPAILHGGETVTRGGSAPVTINFSGLVTDPSSTAQTIVTLLRDEQRRTGVSVAG